MLALALRTAVRASLPRAVAALASPASPVSVTRPLFTFTGRAVAPAAAVAGRGFAASVVGGASAPAGERETGGGAGFRGQLFCLDCMLHGGGEREASDQWTRPHAPRNQIAPVSHATDAARRRRAVAASLLLNPHTHSQTPHHNHATGLAGARLPTCRPPRRPLSTAAAAAVPPTPAAIAAGLPTTTRSRLAAWLTLCAGWTASMIVLGGVTRLTRSGLSMTDWKFTGEKPPSSPADWNAEFAKYRASPEYRLVNSKMTIDEFKAIYWMEWAHRAWGRALGLVFALPAAAFAASGAIRAPLGRRLTLLLALGGGQGLVGWWMVRSGLQEPPPDSRREPRVAPTRLAAHLVSAGTIYCLLAWTAATLAWPVPLAATATAAAATALARARARSPTRWPASWL